MENEIIERVVKLETKSEQYDKDIDKLQNQTEAIYKLANSVELLAKQSSITNEKLDDLDVRLNEKIDGVDSKVNGVDSKVNKLNEEMTDVKTQADKKDARKWDKLMWLIAGVIIATLAGIVKTALGI